MPYELEIIPEEIFEKNRQYSIDRRAKVQEAQIVVYDFCMNNALEHVVGLRKRTSGKIRRR